MTTNNTTRKLLYNGGEAFLNRLGSCSWTIDIWGPDQDKLDEPTYHAFYDNQADAQADFDSWRSWPDGI